MINLCAPAIVYLVFLVCQILIDLFHQNHDDMLAKSIVAVLVTLLLNALCERNLEFVSWMFVFIPLIFMTIMSIVLFNLSSSPVDKLDFRVERLPGIPSGSSSPEYQS